LSSRRPDSFWVGGYGARAPNKIGTDAGHSNIIPDVDAVRFHTKIVSDFLRWSYRGYHGIGYDSVALEDMIFDVPMRNRMTEAKTLIEKNDLTNASKKIYEAIGAFKFLSFGFFPTHVFSAYLLAE
jgi:hypothetical protein